MRLLIIRHCDPDYSIDSLTETGRKEAGALAAWFSRQPADACYVSPMGRAQETARACLAPIGKTAETCGWLREFDCPVTDRRFSEGNQAPYAWDWFPADWTAVPAFYDKDRWMDVPAFASVDMRGCYERVCDGLDGLLKKHGYERDGMNYKAVRASHETIVLFCHFGVECVLLSHLLNVSPMVLWQGTCSAPSGVTSLYTEEREEGIAGWRMNCFGSTEHLALAGLKPSFSARFCECYTDPERH